LHFAYDDVDGAYASLLARGIAVREPIVRSYGMKQVYLKDPDGDELCLQHPVVASDAA
jgi:hypothetical protein